MQGGILGFSNLIVNPFMGAAAPQAPWGHTTPQRLRWSSVQLGCSHQTQAKKAANQTEANITLPRGSVGHCFIL